MKNFLSTIKGKVIAGAITLAVIAAAVVVIVLLNTGYRTISVDELTGVTTITAGNSVSEAFKGQNLKSGCRVFVEESSDLTLELDTDKHLYAKELTSFSLEAVGKPGKDSRTVIKLDKGSVLSEIDEKLAADESYVVESPNATMAVRGTSFTVTVSFDEKNLCHTLVEVEKGTVEVTKKDENGNPTDEVQTLEAGEKTEVVSIELNRDEDNETSSVDNTSSSIDNTSSSVDITSSSVDITSSSVDKTSSSVDNTSSSENNSTPDDDLPPENIDVTYQDHDALAVEAALEAFLNGGDLDNTNFDRVTSLEICGKTAFVTLDWQFGGRGQYMGRLRNLETDVMEVLCDPGSGEEIRIPMSDNTLTDLNFLTGMKNLRLLMVESGKVSDITAIGTLTKIDCLYLCSNEISDISPIQNLTNLELLQLDENQISDISPIKNLKKLAVLTLLSNNISDLSPISRLENLEDLTLDDNNISDLSPINGLTNLTHLDFGRNNISDISPIANFKKLTYISIYDNPINDYSPLYGLTGLQDILCWGLGDDEIAKLKQAFPRANIEG